MPISNRLENEGLEINMQVWQAKTQSDATIEENNEARSTMVGIFSAHQELVINEGCEDFTILLRRLQRCNEEPLLEEGSVND